MPPAIEAVEFEGLVFARLLDGKGGAKLLDWDAVTRWKPSDGVLWMHLNYTHERARVWMLEYSGIEPVIAEALLGDDPRPRSVAHHDGLFLVLRGVNYNPGAEPDDLVSLRVWVEPTRIITVRQRAVRAVRELRHSLEAGTGPECSGDFVAAIATYIMDHLGVVIDNFDEQIGKIEDQIHEQPGQRARPKLIDVRRQVIGVRRYLVPQRDLMIHLPNERLSWLSDTNRLQLREAADHTLHCLEDLDEVRDRAEVAARELSDRLTERVNRNTYLMTLLTAIFLPLNLVAGVFGMNLLNHMEEDPAAFYVVCGVMAAILAAQLWLFRKFRLF